MNEKNIIPILKEIIANESGIEPAEINVNTPFQELGLDSVNSIFVLSSIEKRFDVNIDPLSIYDYPTVESFAKLINSLRNAAR